MKFVKYSLYALLALVLLVVAAAAMRVIGGNELVGQRLTSSSVRCAAPAFRMTRLPFASVSSVVSARLSGGALERCACAPTLLITNANIVAMKIVV